MGIEGGGTRYQNQSVARVELVIQLALPVAPSRNPDIGIEIEEQ
jgi:hypothetical protein